MKKTKKTFHNLFSPKRALFVVFLAILVLGFSANFALAAKLTSNPPKPGDAFSKWPAEWQKAQGADKYLKSGAPNLKDSIAAEDYSKFLQEVGGFSNLDASNKATEYFNASGGEGLAKEAVITGGGKLLEVAGEGVLMAVIGVLSVIAGFLKEFVSYAAQLLDVTLSPGLYSFTNNKMIVQGWVMVRDVCNLFFLLILLFIAICTILKIEKYHAKKTLLTLIIMALLINFSKPIAIFIFDGSQLLMNEFLKQMGTGQSTSTVVAKASLIAENVYKTLPSNSGGTAVAIQYLFGVVFLFMLAVAYLVTAIMLLIRIVAIMILIIVSPLAFFAAIIPDFSKMSSSWWSSLFEYSYYGPAAAFFLLLATNLGDVLPSLRNISGSSGQIDVTVNSILQYLVVIIFLYASIIMAKKFGGGAGAAITNWGNKSLKGGWFRKGGWPREVAGWGARTTGAADVYKGVKGGIAKQPGWRILTKEGREARSKESQEKWEGRVAPFSMATARKKAKEEEFKDQAKVDDGIAKGNAHDLLIGSKRGTLKPEQLEDSKVQKLIANNPELRKEILGNLREKGQSHTAAYLRSLTPEKEDTEKKKTLEDFGKEEIYNNKKLGDMDWEKVITFEHEGKKPFEKILADRLNAIAQTNAQGFLNIASNLDGTKQDILKDKFKDVLKNARESVQNKNTGSQPNTGSQTGGYQSGGYGS